jgi:predicted permease
MNDLRYAIRGLRRSAGLTTLIVLMVGLGIGATTAVFSVIHALLLRPLPVHRPAQLVTLEQLLHDGARQLNLSYDDFERLRALDALFDGMYAASVLDRYDVRAGSAGASDERGVRVTAVTGSYFSVLGLQAQVGRLLTEDDVRDLRGGQVAVISDAYWDRAFGRARDVLGQALTLGGTTLVIVGVGPPAFVGEWVGRPADVWAPVTAIEHALPDLGAAGRNRLQYKVVARLRAGVTLHQAQAAGDLVFRRLQEEPPPITGVSARGRLRVMRAATGYSPQRDAFIEPLVILLAIAGGVLLVACGNVANLLLARATGRQREMAVRLSVGAGRARLVRQLLTEGAVLAALGGALGLLLAWWCTGILAAFAASGPVSLGLTPVQSVVLDPRPDVRVLGFTIVLCAVTTLLFGLAPALRGSRARLVPGMAGAASEDHRGRRFPLVKLLTVLQIGASTVLLFGTGLLVRTARNLKSQDLGFARESRVLVWALPGQMGLGAGDLLALWQRVTGRLAALPGVISAAASVEGLVPGAATGGPLVEVEGAPSGPDAELRIQSTMTVGPGFFATAGQRVLHGREFTWRDIDSTPPVVIVNETLARRAFGNEIPIGRRLAFVRSSLPPLEIVGVVGDARAAPREPAGLRLYYPAGQNLRRLARSLGLVVRVAGDAASMTATVRRELRRIEPTLPVVQVATIDDQVDAVLFQDRLIADVAIVFGGLGLVLACLGVYSVMSFAVAQRTREIGIRMALGLDQQGVLAMTTRESLVLALAGVGVGAPAALTAARLIASRLYGVTAMDPATLTVAAALMIGAAALAGLVPARRAARVDPMVALRCE